MWREEKEYHKDGSLLSAAPDNRLPSSPSSQPINYSVKIFKV
jgi:hypothetical protein